MVGPVSRPATAHTDDGVAAITGTVSLSNPFFLEAGIEPFILLSDLTAFVKRVRDLPLRLLHPAGDDGARRGVVTRPSYSLALPMRRKAPSATSTTAAARRSSSTRSI